MQDEFELVESPESSDIQHVVDTDSIVAKQNNYIQYTHPEDTMAKVSHVDVCFIPQTNARLCENQDQVLVKVAQEVQDLNNGVTRDGVKVKDASVLRIAAHSTPQVGKSIEISHRLITDTYTKFVTLVDERQPSATNVVIFITYLVKLVKELSIMKKSRRVELILAVIRKYVDTNVVGTSEEKEIISDLFESTLPFVLDVLDNENLRIRMLKILKSVCACFNTNSPK